MLITSEKTDHIFKALFDVQGVVGNIKRNADNPFFNSRYVTYDQAMARLRGPLQAAGLLLTHTPGPLSTIMDDKVMTTSMTARVTHVESGEWIEACIDLPLGKPDCQGLGATHTYGCRYLLFQIFALAPSDDDGNSGVRGVEEFIAEIEQTTTEQQLCQWGIDNAPFIQEAALPRGGKAKINRAYSAHRTELRGAAEAALDKRKEAIEETEEA